MCQYGRLEPQQLKRLAMNRGELGSINLDGYSGIILGGGPANVTDPPEVKAKRTYEPRLYELLRELLTATTLFWAPASAWAC